MGRGLAEPGRALAQQVPLTVEVAVVGAAGAGCALEATYRRLVERHRRANARLRRDKGGVFLSGVVFLPATLIRPFPALFLGHIGLRQSLLESMGMVVLVVLGIVALISVWAWVKGTSLDAPLEALGLRLPLVARVSAFTAMEVAAAARPNPRHARRSAGVHPVRRGWSGMRWTYSVAVTAERSDASGASTP